jgi:glyoxylase-like metal-dependent hydrolase (beta-lactamase superfamily II)
VVEILTIQTPSLGDRSYLVTDGVVAFVVDPQRDIDRVLALTASRGIAVTHVFETHIHNDYVTGGLALARATGAAYHVNAADSVGFDRVAIADGDAVSIGASMQVTVIATPGHTFTHLSYALTDPATGEPAAVFTGGSLLHGSAGRPDLLGAEHAPALAAAQRTSLRRLAAQLPDQAVVYPTHGFGSFCAGRPGRVRRRADQAAPRRGRVGRGPAQPPGVRGRAPARVAQLRVRRQPSGQPWLAAAPWHPADADRLQPRSGRRRPARPGQDRHREHRGHGRTAQRMARRNAPAGVLSGLRLR